MARDFSARGSKIFAGILCGFQENLANYGAKRPASGRVDVFKHDHYKEDISYGYDLV